MTKCKAVNTEKENGSNIKERQRLSTPLLTVTTQGGAVAHHRAKEVGGWSPCRLAEGKGGLQLVRERN